VLGNGDSWEGGGALRRVAETGCDGGVVGRGGLGRPWLFADLAAAFARPPDRALPTLGQVAQVLRRHAEPLTEGLVGEAARSTEWLGGEVEGCTDFRKPVAWYLKGFPVGPELRRALAMVSTLSELDDLLGKLDPDAPFPTEVLGQPRGRTNSPGKVYLPEGWLR